MPYFTFTYTKVVLARKSRRTYGVQKPYKSILYNKKSTTFTIPFRINIMVSLWCRWWNPEPRRARLRKRWQQTAPTESKEGVSHAVCSNRSPINQHQKTEGTPSGYPLFLVPVVGLEPTRCRHQRILSPSRLPIPSHRRVNRDIIADTEEKCKDYFSSFLDSLHKIQKVGLPNGRKMWYNKQKYAHR